MDRILDRFGHVQEEYEHLGGYALESQAREVLHGLGFKDDQIDGDVGALSGGWKMRVALARVLLGMPDVLLMDEPTNHLDIESIIWLEQFLKSFPGALLMTSHDPRVHESPGLKDCRDRRRRNHHLLRVTTASTSAKGLCGKATSRQRSRGSSPCLPRNSASLIVSGRTLRRRPGAGQSRIKAFDKIEKIELPKKRQVVKFDFGSPPRSGEQVAVLENLHKSYGPRVIYEGFNLTIRRGEH